ncbi:MAG TPA: PAS domain-containing protein [Trichocoleus sp.]
MQQPLPELEAIYQSAPVGLGVLDTDLRFVRVNHRLAALHGLPVEAHIGRTLREVLPNLAAATEEILQPILETGEPRLNVEITGETPSQPGAQRVWLEHFLPLRVGDRIVGISAVCDEITERQQAEAALRQSEEFKQRMVESSNDCIKVLDLSGRLLYMNSRGRCQMEIDDFEFVRYGQWSTFWPGEGQAKAEAAIAAALAGGTGQFQAFCPTAKGKPKWWDVVVTPMQAASGEVVQLLSVSRDISEHVCAEAERKQAEAALKTQTEHTQLLYETTRDLLSTAQPLTLVETVFNKLKGLIGVDFYLTYVADDQHQLEMAFHGGLSEAAVQDIKRVEQGQTLCGAVAQRHSQVVLPEVRCCVDAKAQWAEALGVSAYACHPLIAQGKLFGTLGFGSRSRGEFTAAERELFQAICDQTAIALERSQLVSSLQQQTEELTRANQAKDEFLAVLSHELRTPLSSILGWSHLLQMRQASPEKIQQGLAIIERSARQQVQLVEDLLDVARIIHGKLKLDATQVDLKAPVTAALDMVRLAAEAKSIRLELVLDPTLDPISGDPDRLQQVVWNLLSNAIKFTPVGGTVSVRLSQSRGQAQIQVSDSGKGIEPEFIPHVFESFRQQDSSTTRQHGGLGLGLAIARQVVEAHQGTISVASAGAGQGTTFTVQLPQIAASRVNWPSSPRQLACNLETLRVLVVDDDPACVELIGVLLEEEGMIVQTATSAAEALGALSQAPFDLLISDIGMPKMDGYELIREVRALTPVYNRDIQALALTAYAGENNHRRALVAGFQAYLTKPIHPQQLLREVAKLALPAHVPIPGS